MSAANILFTVVGVIAFLVGLGMLVTAIRSGVDERPRNQGLLIAGMMLTAFGLVLAGFAIGYATTKPLTFESNS
jgi:uncharacterized membrane protein HdeD (DUF308 family)